MQSTGESGLAAIAPDPHRRVSGDGQGLLPKDTVSPQSYTESLATYGLDDGPTIP